MSKQVTGKDAYHIGIISDTHGRLPSSVYMTFENMDLIIHAGDIDTKEVLEELQSIAPVVAVRGNMDFGPWTESLRESETVEVGGLVLYVRHIVGNIPASALVDVVISGHTHRPSITKQKGVLFLNPGSAGLQRYDNPLSVALLHIQDKEPHAQIVELEE
ncbi:MAG: metallophosphoesterase [Desulfobacteraceae bacterium]|nr:MAG: metallophosphoesterase [Desulfobacteraceae bacterium]